MGSEVERYWTQAEVAKRWRCSEANIKNLRERGLIGYFQFGRSIRYLQQDIIEFEGRNTKRRKGGAPPKARSAVRKPDVSPASPTQWRI